MLRLRGAAAIGLALALLCSVPAGSAAGSSPPAAPTPLAAKKQKQKCKKGQKRDKKGHCEKKKKKKPTPTAPVAPGIPVAPTGRPSNVLSAGIAVPNGPLYTGRTTTYFVTVTNTSPNLSASGVTLTLKLPPATVASLPSGCSPAGADVSCVVGPLVPGETAARFVPVRHQVAGGYASSAAAFSNEGDQAASAAQGVTVSDLIGREFPSSVTLPVDTNGVFTLRMENLGAASAHAITPRMLLPVSVSFVGTIPGGLCTGAPVGAQVLVTCDPVDLTMIGSAYDLMIELGFNTAGSYLIGFTGTSAEGDPAFSPQAIVTVGPPP